MSDEDDLPEYQYDDDFIIEEWEDWVKPFIAQDLQQLPSLKYFSNPTTTNYQRELEIWKKLEEKIPNYEDKITLVSTNKILFC